MKTLSLLLAFTLICNLNAQEPIAKLSAPEKSMILSQFVEGALRPELCRQVHTQESRTWRQSDKMAQNGDFAGAESLAIGSQDSSIPSKPNRDGRATSLQNWVFAGGAILAAAIGCAVVAINTGSNAPKNN